MWAAINGRTEVVQQLVKAGANLDLQNIVCQYVETYMIDVLELSQQLIEIVLI